MDFSSNVSSPSSFLAVSVWRMAWYCFSDCENNSRIFFEWTFLALSAMSLSSFPCAFLALWKYESAAKYRASSVCGASGYRAMARLDLREIPIPVSLRLSTDRAQIRSRLQIRRSSFEETEDEVFECLKLGGFPSAELRR